MRVVLLTHGGADLVIERLAALEGIVIAAVIIEKPRAPQRGPMEKIRRSVKYDGITGTLKKTFFRNGAGPKEELSVDRTEAAAEKLGITVQHVDDYHSPNAIEEIRQLNADLGVVYGTNIIKESVFSIPRLGSINLHQGLAPYYRGGPPVFWELFNGEKEIGLTAHFVAPKVDTGDIICQKKLPLAYDHLFGSDFESFIDHFREGLRLESAELMAAAVATIASGKLRRIVQDTRLGRRYRLPTKKEKDDLRRRLRAANRGTDE